MLDLWVGSPPNQSKISGNVLQKIHYTVVQFTNVYTKLMARGKNY